MVALIGTQISRRIAIASFAMSVVPMSVVTDSGNRQGRAPVAMRRGGPSMKAGQDQRHQAKQNDKSAHGALPSAMRAH